MGKLNLRVIRTPFKKDKDGKFIEWEQPHANIIERITAKFSFFATTYGVDVEMAYDGQSMSVIDESLSKNHGTLKEDFLLQLSEIATQIKELAKEPE